MKTKFEHPMLDVLLQHDHVLNALHVVDLTDVERALVWKDDRLAFILGPGRHALWKTPYRLYVEAFNISAFRFEHPAPAGDPAEHGRAEVARRRAGEFDRRSPALP